MSPTRILPALVAVCVAGCSDSSDGTVTIVDRGDAPHAGGRGGSSGGGDAAFDAQGGAGGSAAKDGGPGTDADASARGGNAGDSSTAAGTDGAPAAVPGGLIVAYDAQSGGKTLYVLDSETGRPLSSEPMGVVSAILNDESRDPSDRWYVFERTGVAGEDTLHVRRLDSGTNRFEELGTLAGVPTIFGRPVAFGTGGERFVAYLSDAAAGSSKADLALTVVDATDPTNPVVIGQATQSLPAGEKLGLLGDGSSVDAVVVQGAPCPTGASGSAECNVSLVHHAVSRTAVAVGATSVVGATGPDGNVDFVVDPGAHERIVAFPPVAGIANPACSVASRASGLVRRLSSAATPAAPDVSIPTEAVRFSGAALDRCDDVVFFSALAGDTAIWAVPFGAAQSVTKLCRSTGGGPLAYDPYSRTLFRALPAGGIEAFRVSNAGRASTLTERTLAELPAGMILGAIAVRGASSGCP